MSEAAQQLQNTEPSQEGRGQQYLTFILDQEEYGVDILKVYEIKGWSPATPIPGTPEYMKGVINLRGAIVPVIDLRQRFSLEALEYGPTTVVIVLNVNGPRGEQIIGMVVDAVSDTCNIDNKELKPAPDVGGVVSVDYIKGLASINNKMVIVLDIDLLLSSDELNQVAQATDNQAQEE